MKIKYLLIIFFIFINSINAFYIKNKTNYLVKFKLERMTLGQEEIEVIKEKDIFPGNIAEIIIPEQKENEFYRFSFYVPELNNFKIPANETLKTEKDSKISIIDKLLELQKEISKAETGLFDPLIKLIVQFAAKNPVELIQDDYSISIK